MKKGIVTLEKNKHYRVYFYLRRDSNTQAGLMATIKLLIDA